MNNYAVTYRVYIKTIDTTRIFINGSGFSQEYVPTGTFIQTRHGKGQVLECQRTSRDANSFREIFSTKGSVLL